MQNENTKRAWLYARIPGNDVETLRCIRECAAKAQQDNYHLVESEGGKPFDYDRRAEQSFADFISDVKDVKTVKLCAENNN